ncbi:unnamed protein product [Clonostachys rhizophaga]|uniref:Terpenoid synthase n=1 Tax=Clonostachys rhizophaga TaxID=160324 RepID=A0A9N9VQA6_9HYPO|nr:unnamed protein product [Clonostachys rhizophaga]
MAVSSYAASNLLAQVQGQTMYVPPLDCLYSHWNQGVNPLVEEIRPLVEELLVRYAPQKEDLDHVRASAYCLFAATWYPDCDLQRLQFAVIYAIFLFFWDDNMDREEGSSHRELTYNINLGTQYRSEAKAYVNWHLGFEANGCPEPEYRNPQLEMFGMAAKILRKMTDKDTLSRFRDHLFFFILGLSFPKALLDSREMLDCWTEVNKNIILYVLKFDRISLDLLIDFSYSENDLLSFKKEVADGATTTLIPVLMNEHCISMNEAVALSVAGLAECCKRFDMAAAALRKRAMEFDINVQNDVGRLVRCFETMQSGCYNWSKKTDRYGVGPYRKEDGSLQFQL